MIANMKVLVTGGAGFQGSHIVESLIKKNHHVIILNTYSVESERNLNNIKKGENLTVIWGSTTDPETVIKSIRNVSLVVHLAARVHVGQSIQDPTSTILANVNGGLNILEGIRNIPEKDRPRLILWSSCEVYGEPRSGKLNESSEFLPKSPYATSKAAVDRIAYAYNRSYGLDVTIVRPFNVFGERQKSGSGGAVIPIFIEKALRGEPLTVFGKGEQTRDYLYISDLVSAFEIVLKNTKLFGEAINFASGENTSIIGIAKYIANKFGVKVVHKDPLPGEVMKFPADFTKAKKLGFSPKVSIWDGIDRYIAWRTGQ